MTRIGSNISALQAIRRLAQSSSELGTTFERLSSGLRINRAADDAAGLSVADQLRVNARLFGAAVRNLNDGLSLLGIVDGTLSQQSEIITRLKELATQSSNGSLSDDQRRTLDREYSALVQEFGRLGDTATFNGLRLLRSSHADGNRTLSIQAGINGSANSILSLTGVDTGSWSGAIDLSRLATTDFDEDGDSGIDGDFELFGEPIAFDALLAAFDDQLAHLRFIDSDGNERELALGFLTDGTSVSVVSFVRSLTDDTYQATSDSITTFAQMVGGSPGDIAIDPTTQKLSGTTTVTIQTGVGASLSLDLSALEFRDMSSSGTTISSLEFTGVRTTSQALFSLDALNSKLNDINQYRGQIGAVQSRFESALQVLAASREASLAAESRIRDIDIGQESAALVRLQILQQAGAAVLSQANVQPQLALTLLRG